MCKQFQLSAVEEGLQTDLLDAVELVQALVFDEGGSRTGRGITGKLLLFGVFGFGVGLDDAVNLATEGLSVWEI